MAGIADVPMRIPLDWTNFRAWFENTFVKELLAPADIRNATGEGVTISSNGNSKATLTSVVTQDSVDDDIEDAIDAHEAAADPHPAYLTQAEADVLYESTNSILAPCTVAQLPTAVGRQGVRGMVTDANATTFLSTVAAGGSNIVPVISDGTNWKIG